MKNLIFSAGLVVLLSTLSAYANYNCEYPSQQGQFSKVDVIKTQSAVFVGRCDAYRLNVGNLVYRCTRADGSFGGTYTSDSDCSSSCR